MSGSNEFEQTTINLYKTSYINNRRYLGNKYKLLPFIKKVVEKECQNISTFADIFAGTGAVTSAFKDKVLITNDLMYSNYICNFAWFGSQEYETRKIIQIITYYNSLSINEDNYMTENFANTFFSYADCSKIGFIREDIEKRYKDASINERERALLITSLLYAMDKIANTCGHYDAYIQDSIFDKNIELHIPLADINNNKNNKCYNLDANILVRQLDVDLVYIDPPYNSRQYCDAYHLLENVAKWEKPPVFGIARKMDRSNLKSAYCTANATEAFEDLIKNIKAKYILFSYNNMATKGNERSNAKIDDKDILRILKQKGNVTIFSENYRTFSTGKSNIQDHAERLFLCDCREQQKIIQSPLNYTGGKFKLLPQILPFFPNDINLFVDLFCGGCNVGINVKCNYVLFNDHDKNLLYLYNTFKNLDKEVTFELIFKTIEQYGLSQVDKYGYSYYGCDSSKGLGDFNKDPFLRLRADFNSRVNEDYYTYILLYVLIIYSFNNQIRFNSKGKFNLPVGKRDFNLKMQKKLSDFIDRLKTHNTIFKCIDFKKFDTSTLDKNDFVYIDPPYLIACATYNENNAWNEEEEKELLFFLDKLDKQNIRFALSNVLRSKGKENTLLLEWLNNNKDKYKVINLNYSYSNSNYQTKDKTSGSYEVLIINY